jgi:hypothetical protein
MFCPTTGSRSSKDSLRATQAHGGCRTPTSMARQPPPPRLYRCRCCLSANRYQCPNFIGAMVLHMVAGQCAGTAIFVSLCLRWWLPTKLNEPNNPGKAQGVILGREEAVEKAEKNWGTIFILASRRKIASRNLFLVTSKNNSANFSPPTILKNESNTLLIDPRQHLNLF